MKWLSRIFKDVVNEALDEMEVPFDIVDEKLDKKVFGTEFNIPINIQIDGKDLEPITKEYKNKMVDLVIGGWLQKAIERYLGEQFKEIVLTVDEDAKKIIQGKIMGLSEFYRELLQIEFEARESVGQEAIVGDEPTEVE